MCIFSRAVEHVSDTHLFARMEGARQYLVYSMEVSTLEDTAMTLPLPMAADAGEDAVRFINLQGYPDFFHDMREGFPERSLRNGPRGLDAAPLRGLKVHSVGAFEASYVPSVQDFSRLDERFRLPKEVWSRVGRYEDYGFVVFKLRAGTKGQVHPMAFSFATRDSGSLFFPTVHIHDGKVHGEADFDHELYYQAEGGGRPKYSVSKSSAPASSFMKVERARELLRAEWPCHKVRLQGRQKNLDTRIKL